MLATLEAPPEKLGVTHWSTRLLAAHLSGQGSSISNAWVARIWRKWGLQPWRREDVQVLHRPAAGGEGPRCRRLYLNPPEKAVVLSIDEKSQIQALDRTAPILPMRPGLPEKATHDYVRHGTHDVVRRVGDRHPARSPMPVIRGTAAMSSSNSSSRSRRPTRG